MTHDDDDIPSVHDVKNMSADLFFEGTEFEPVVREPNFELGIGESCHARPDHVAALPENMSFKIVVRRVDEKSYWYLDTEGCQGIFTKEGMTFDPTCWEKD